MEQTTLLPSFVLLGFISLLLAGEIMLARRLERGRAPKPSGQLPYTWGYFFGIQGIVFAALGIVGAFVSPDIDKSAALFGSIIAVLGWGIPGYFVIQRRRWAWIALTILSFNIFIWVANYFYGRNRSNEYDQPAQH